MLGIFGKLFGSDKAIDAGINAIDSIVYTEEEKANMELSKAKIKIELLNAYEPFKIAQRYLALIFSGSFVVTMFIAVVLALLGKSYQSLLDVVETFNLGYIVLAIVTFYFGGGLVNSARKK